MRTDKQCNICQEDFNDDWESSTLCVHDECLMILRRERDKEKEICRLMTIQAQEYRLWVVKAEQENIELKAALSDGKDNMAGNKKYYAVVREEFEKELALNAGWGRNEIMNAFDRAIAKAVMTFLDEQGR